MISICKLISEVYNSQTNIDTLVKLWITFSNLEEEANKVFKDERGYMDKNVPNLKLLNYSNDDDHLLEISRKYNLEDLAGDLDYSHTKGVLGRINPKDRDYLVRHIRRFAAEYKKILEDDLQTLMNLDSDYYPKLNYIYLKYFPPSQ